ncbi:MAG: helix-turn-helix domain-containing protein [Rubricoccaceae bacterium]
MTADDLKRLVALGEGTHLEFKHRMPRAERLAREVIALANTAGGRVLLGVDDDGTLVGLKDADEELFVLEEALRTRIEPPVEVRIESVRVSRRREVLVVDVPASAARPHFLVWPPENGRTPPRAAFLRVADQSVEASREAVRLMRAEASGEPVQFTFGDAERRLLEYLDRHERITSAAYARLADLPPWRASKTLVLLTRAGVLRFHASAGEDYFTAA